MSISNSTSILYFRSSLKLVCWKYTTKARVQSVTIAIDYGSEG